MNTTQDHFAFHGISCEDVEASLVKQHIKLSQYRAIAVVEVLVELRLPKGALAARGYGCARPLEPGEYDAAENQRVEFRVGVPGQ